MADIQYGVQYPDGRYDWTIKSSFGEIDTPERRANFREQYRLRLESLGVVADVPLVFVSRQEITSFTDPVVIDDPALPEEEVTPE